jgi:hypothetical protein
MTVKKILLVMLVSLVAGASFAQDRWFRPTPQLATEESFDGAFHYCRLAYRSSRGGDGGGWGTDFPDADINLSIRLGELTKIRISRNDAGHPQPLVVRMTDDTLFHCPFIMAQEVGSIFITDEEAVRLREYLLKGGFLWVDDYWGSYAWDVWYSQITKVFPPGEYPNVDIPKDHKMFQLMFHLKDGVPQVPSINHWFGSGGGTSERGADSAEVHTRGIFDKKGRLMVLQTHNTDISDSWEREGEDSNYFLKFSVDGYALAVDVVLYALTH